MKVFDFLKKYLAPGILGAITVDSYRRQIINERKSAVQEALRNKSERELAKEVWEENIIHQNMSNGLQARNNAIEEINKNISNKEKLYETLTEKLNTKNFSNGENAESVNTWLNYQKSELVKLNKDKDEKMNELCKYINDNVKKSDTFDWFNDLIEKYQSFLNNLSLDQIVALFNIICEIMILMALTSICILLIGDFLINKFNLDTRYPRLSKYIRMKEKLNKYYLKYYIILLYIIVILCLCGNIYMFLLRYLID